MSNLWSSVIKQSSAIFGRITNKRFVGKDLHGNSYYLSAPRGSDNERRFIEYKDGDVSPETVPMSWHGWLRFHRDNSPTIDELNAEVTRSADLARRVAVLTDADKKLRLREQTERRLNGESSSFGDMSAAAMIQQMEQQQPTQTRPQSGDDRPSSSADERSR